MRLLWRVKRLCHHQGIILEDRWYHNGLWQNEPHTDTYRAKFRQSNTPTMLHMLISPHSVTRPPPAHPSPLLHYLPSSSVHFHTSSSRPYIKCLLLEKRMTWGRGQSKEYLFIKLRAHYINVSVIPRRQTIQPPGVAAPRAKPGKSYPRAAPSAGEPAKT